MMTPDAARHFAHDWIEAWNAHDLERILSHYADDVHVTSPVARRLTGTADVIGKANLREYFALGLSHYPDLKFKLLEVFVGADSLVLSYVNQNGTRAAEMMALNDKGEILRMKAHYA